MHMLHLTRKTLGRSNIFYVKAKDNWKRIQLPESPTFVDPQRVIVSHRLVKLEIYFRCEGDNNSNINSDKMSYGHQCTFPPTPSLKVNGEQTS